MSYLVFARKFRPQTFADMVGQEHVTQTLTNAIQKGRVHHAFLFTGARGVGKTTAARILAKCLSCEKAPTDAPCNACDACREITAGTSVDVQEIDGASNNSVDDVRTLREGVRYLPVRGKKKVYIIDEVHMLSSGAFNALLKTLEEPPAHAVFIFATTEAHKIPVTILSRLQRYDFRLVPRQRIGAHLSSVLSSEKIPFVPAALEVIAREAAGSVRDSLSLLEQVLASGHGALASEQAAAAALGVADRSLVRELGSAILARETPRALELVRAAADRAIDWKHFTHALLEHLRDLVVARTVPDPASLIEASESELGELLTMAKTAPAGRLELLFARFAKTAEEVLRSPLPRYVLEVGLVELGHVEPLEPLGMLIDRLERLEARLATGATPGPAALKSATRSTPPAAPSPPSEVVAPTARAAITRWSVLAEAMSVEQPLLSVFLHGEEVVFAPPQVVVSFPSAFNARQARDKAADAAVHMERLLGVKVRLEIQEGAGHAPSAIATEEKKQREDREQRRKEAIDHPARKLITDRFGSETIFQEPEVE